MLRAVAVLALVVAATASQPPSPTPAKETQGQQNQASKVRSEPHVNQQATGSAAPALAQPRAIVTTGNQTNRGEIKKDHPAKDRPATNWWEIVGTIAGVVNTILLTLFSGALAILAYCQWRAMDRQAKLMRRQAVLMGRQLAQMETTSADTHDLASAAKQSAIATRDLVQVMQRAWISVEVVIADELRFINGDLRLAFGFRLKNVGHTVANKIQVRSAIILARADYSADLPFDTQAKLALPPPSIFGKTLFPGEEDEWYDMLFAGKRDIASAILEGAQGASRIAPVVVGCVVYEYSNSDVHHVTRFAYMISRKVAGLLPPPPFVPSIEVDVALVPNQIEFRKFFWGGAEAD